MKDTDPLVASVYKIISMLCGCSWYILISKYINKLENLSEIEYLRYVKMFETIFLILTFHKDYNNFILAVDRSISIRFYISLF